MENASLSTSSHNRCWVLAGPSRQTHKTHKTHKKTATHPKRGRKVFRIDPNQGSGTNRLGLGFEFSLILLKVIVTPTVPSC